MKRLTIRLVSFVLCVVALCFVDAAPVLVASAQEAGSQLYVVNFRPPDIPLEKLAAFPRSQASATANRIWSVVPGNTAFLAVSVSQRAATARVRCGELSGASVMRSS